jgi:hypothetical protein
VSLTLHPLYLWWVSQPIYLIIKKYNVLIAQDLQKLNVVSQQMKLNNLMRCILVFWVKELKLNITNEHHCPLGCDAVEV